ncbi:hypothetical protein QVD17_08657 [Tagetes erecta]|uniref:Uncharacterized protein n=1 Tax=Tagetes erecta TaxID=13708 RepID=A0AAD8KZ98_TARER|nr:hypothetical protein QVD17_08657 [Tagetes erecta]
MQSSTFRPLKIPKSENEVVGASSSTKLPVDVQNSEQKIATPVLKRKSFDSLTSSGKILKTPKLEVKTEVTDDWDEFWSDPVVIDWAMNFDFEVNKDPSSLDNTPTNVSQQTTHPEAEYCTNPDCKFRQFWKYWDSQPFARQLQYNFDDSDDDQSPKESR